jgi:hypothetical protein
MYSNKQHPPALLIYINLGKPLNLLTFAPQKQDHLCCSAGMQVISTRKPTAIDGPF